MNAITRWDPLKEMEELQNRLSNLLGRTPARLGDAKLNDELALAERRLPGSGDDSLDRRFPPAVRAGDDGSDARRDHRRDAVGRG